MEGKVPQSADLQNLVIILLEGSRLHISPKGVGHQETAVAIRLSGGQTVRLLYPSPALQILDHLGDEGNRTDGILRLRRLNHNFRGRFPWINRLLHFIQPVQRTTNIQSPALEIHILPL